MNFLQGTFFICHSFRRRCQPGRMGSFQMCLQAAVRRTCRGRKNLSALLRITTPLLRKIAHHKPHLGNIQPSKGMIEPHVGISKPVEALNKLHVNISLLRCYTLRNFAAPVVTTTFIDQTSAKAVACLYRQSCTRTTYLSKNYVSISLTKHFHVMDIEVVIGAFHCLWDLCHT